jgi:hypothetical protein
MTLVEFIRARIADDEAAGKVGDEKGCRAARDRPDTTFDPRRVLADCEARRTVVASYERLIRDARDGGASDGTVLGLERVLKCIASPYADHPDHRPEWSPTYPF